MSFTHGNGEWHNHMAYVVAGDQDIGYCMDSGGEGKIERKPIAMSVKS